MRLTLEVVIGPGAPRGFVVPPGSTVRVGRKGPCELVVDDLLMSRQHLAVAFDGGSCRVRDLESGHGTFIKEDQVGDAEVVVLDGALIRAGSTMLRVRLRPERDPSAPATAGPPSDLHRRVLEHLRDQPGRLHAVLDAARDARVLDLLQQSAEHFQSLYEGPPAERYAKEAPYLVALPRDCEFLEALVREGWGKSWGTFLTSAANFDEVRKHLRRFLTVELEGGRKVLFRFYDPRVVGPFLPSCSVEELTQVFGPIAVFVIEGPNGKAVVDCSLKGGALLADRLSLTES